MSAFPGVTYAVMAGLLAAALPQIDKGFGETQQWNQMPGNRIFIRNAIEKSVIGNTFGWNIRMRSATGSTKTLRPYQTVNYTKNYYTETFTVPFRDKVNDAFVFDRLEIARNMSSPERIYEIIKEARSAQKEDIANTNEAQIFDVGDSNDDDSAIFGLPYWLRRSMDSTGAFISNPDGGFTGTYWRGRSGAISSIVANKDISQLSFERAKTYNATHNGVMDRNLARQIKIASTETEFEMIEGLEGEKGPQGEDVVLFMEPEFCDQYDELCASGPDPRYSGGVGDIYPGTKGRRIYGIQVVRTPALKNKAERPIYGVRKSLIQCVKGRGMWMVEGELKSPGSHNVIMKPMDYTWQMFAHTDYRRCGFLIHGSFATGS